MKSLPCQRTAVWGHPREHPGRRPKNRATSQQLRSRHHAHPDSVGRPKKKSVAILARELSRLEIVTVNKLRLVSFHVAVRMTR